MNNDIGKTFIIALVMIILRLSSHTEVCICCTEQCMEWSINYLLMDTTTSETQAFRGWPDFCLTEKTVGVGVMHITIGEMESHGDCLSQLGIYTIGQFKSKGIQTKKLGCTAEYKEKAVNLAVCSISEEDVVSLQLVDSTSKIDLQDENGIKRFSSLISTIRNSPSSARQAYSTREASADTYACRDHTSSDVISVMHESKRVL